MQQHNPSEAGIQRSTMGILGKSNEEHVEALRLVGAVAALWQGQGQVGDEGRGGWGRTRCRGGRRRRGCL